MTENLSVLMRSDEEESSSVEREPVKERKSLPDKEKTSMVFDPTIVKWLKNENIERIVEPSAQIIQAITEEKFAYPDYQELKQNAEKVYKPVLIDINGDGKNELAILSNCGEDKLCQFWILKQSNKSFEVILSTYREVESFKLQKAKTKGFYNIETRDTYDNSPDFAAKVHKFYGKQYYISDCFEYNYRYLDKNGKLREVRKPIKSRLHCC